MSKYVEASTVLSEEKYLVAALKEMGFTPEVHAEGAHLYGYHGDVRRETAHVIIRRAQIGSASNDVGFVKEGGTYRAIISEYDSRGPSAKYPAEWMTEFKPQARGYNQTWLGALQQKYTELRMRAVASTKGYVYKGRTVAHTSNGVKVQLKFAVR